MSTKHFRQFFALTLLALFGSGLYGQFQQLYSYSSSGELNTGTYRDIACLFTEGPNGESVVAVGSNDAPIAHGLLGYHDSNGIPLNYLDFFHPNLHPVEGTAICRTPTNNLVSCYFDPDDFATDVVMTDNVGTVLFTTRILNVRVRDVVSASMPVPGGAAIWLTGHTQSPNVALIGLDALGGTLFANEYFLSEPFSKSKGYELDFSPFLNRITIVGETEVGGCANGMMLLRTTVAGAFTMGRVYSDPDCASNIVGKALGQKPGGPGRYAFLMERDSTGDTTTTFPAVMEITPGGAIVWSNEYEGTGFFRGVEENSRGGIATDGNNYIVNGIFESPSTPAGQLSSFTLRVALGGNGQRFNEYETGSAFPSVENRLKNIVFHPLHNRYFTAGHFRTTFSSSPWGTTHDNSFWIVSTDPGGNSDCSNSGNVITRTLPLNIASFTIGMETIGTGPSPLVNILVQPRFVDQCPPMKTGENLDEMLESNSPELQIAFLEGRDQIRIDVPSEMEGTAQVKVMDLQGRTLATAKASPGTTLIDVSAFSRGIYLVSYEIAGQISGVKKIAVR